MLDHGEKAAQVLKVHVIADWLWIERHMAIVP